MVPRGCIALRVGSRCRGTWAPATKVNRKLLIQKIKAATRFFRQPLWKSRPLASQHYRPALRVLRLAFFVACWRRRNDRFHPLIELIRRWKNLKKIYHRPRPVDESTARIAQLSVCGECFQSREYLNAVRSARVDTSSSTLAVD
jgi:hypothetical protein